MPARAMGISYLVAKQSPLRLFSALAAAYSRAGRVHCSASLVAWRSALRRGVLQVPCAPIGLHRAGLARLKEQGVASAQPLEGKDA